jgi:ADP-heptose:LPS heptosyltransferase
LKRSLLIRGLWGLGDNIYSRPFVRAAAQKYDVWLETPWPELYEDLDIRFVLGKRKLRTQLKNIARQPASRWSRPPPMRELKIFYGADLARMSIIGAIERRFQFLGIAFDPGLFDLPFFEQPGWSAGAGPIAVVRPATVRAEWRNEARNPRPEYLSAIASELMASHTVVCIADLAPDEEWLVGELPPAHFHLVRGELNVCDLIALLRAANVVIGGVGWIVPAGLALRTKTFVVLGGHGGHNAPEKITDPRLDLSRIGFAMPENFCQCTNMLHSCNKTLADVMGQFFRWSNNLQVAAC